MEDDKTVDAAVELTFVKLSLRFELEPRLWSDIRSLSMLCL